MSHDRPSGLHGRIVATIGGVTFIDHSRATNTHAAHNALTEIRPAIWIGGGRPLGHARTDALVRAARHVRHAVLMGEHARELAARFAKLGIAHSVAADMQEAVAIAAEAAERGDIVLLAPGYASFDMYEDHVHRSWAFSCAVASLSSNPAP